MTEQNITKCGYIAGMYNLHFIKDDDWGAFFRQLTGSLQQ